MDTGRPSLSIVDSDLLAGVKAQYGQRWRIWQVRGLWHAHRVGDFCQEAWDGAPRYAVFSATLLGLVDELDEETVRDGPRGRLVRSGRGGAS